MVNEENAVDNASEDDCEEEDDDEDDEEEVDKTIVQNKVTNHKTTTQEGYGDDDTQLLDEDTQLTTADTNSQDDSFEERGRKSDKLGFWESLFSCAAVPSPPSDSKRMTLS